MFELRVLCFYEKERGSVRHKYGQKRFTHVQKDDGKEEDFDNSSSSWIKSSKKFCVIAMITGVSK